MKRELCRIMPTSGARRKRKRAETVDRSVTASIKTVRSRGRSLCFYDSVEQLPPNHRHLRSKTCAAVVEELVCPISLELPFQPVVAEDGRIYERSVMETHFKACQKRRVDIRSPMTNERMGTRLHPVPQIKNVIQSLVEDDLVPNPLAQPWKQKMANEHRKRARSNANEETKR
eukprot:scaffold4674_cov188-Amphora_coffeaeformis.AAC.1